MNYYKYDNQKRNQGFENSGSSKKETTSQFSTSSYLIPSGNIVVDKNSSDSDIEDVKIQNIRNDIEIVKKSMMNNIDQVVERGENLEVLINKSDSLNQNSYRFNNQAKVLRKKLCRRNFLKGILVLIVILLIIYIIIGSTCGFDLSCLKKH